MFAVKGWAVPTTALKTQTAQTNGEAVTDEAEESIFKIHPSRKRKRKGPEAATTTELLPSQDLSDLWHEHIEKNNKSKAEPGASKHSTKKVTPQAATPSEPSKHGKASDHLARDNAPSKAERSSKEKPKVSDATGAQTNGAPTSQDTKADKTDEQRSRKKSKKEPKQDAAAPATSAATADDAPKPSTSKPNKLTTLQSSMRAKLVSSRFRHLNETLYTKPSADSLSLFATNPELFSEYHDGFRRQVDAWPENPRDTFLRWIKVRGALDVDVSPNGTSRIEWKERKQQVQRLQQLQRNDPSLLSKPEEELLPRHPNNGHCTIADLGCGEGQLGKALIDVPSSSKKKKNAPKTALTKRLQLYVHSFDLSSTAPHVVVADMRSLPLQNDSVDVAIFCLALMGTNWLEFVDEAARILRWRGELWVSEVGSRFASLPSPKKVVEHSVGKKQKKQKPKKAEADDGDALAMVDEEDAPEPTKTDTAAFVAVLRRRGFQLLGQPEVGHRAMFVRLRFSKCLPPTKGKGAADAAGAGSSNGGHAARKKQQLAFIDEKPAEEISDEAEAVVLKPCVYKIR